MAGARVRIQDRLPVDRPGRLYVPQHRSRVLQAADPLEQEFLPDLPDRDVEGVAVAAALHLPAQRPASHAPPGDDGLRDDLPGRLGAAPAETGRGGGGRLASPRPRQPRDISPARAAVRHLLPAACRGADYHHGPSDQVIRPTDHEHAWLAHPQRRPVRRRRPDCSIAELARTGEQVNGKHERRGAEGTGNQGFLAFFSAIALFGVLSMLPTILPALHLHLHPTAPTTSYGATLMMAPREPRGVHVPAVAEPIHPELAPATLPTASQSQESAMVSAEDSRLRAILHAGAHAFSPEIISFRGSLPTLFLTGERQPYTAATLVHYGALVILKHQAALLLDNVYVGMNATLDLGGTTLRTLYLDSGSGGFATIVSWGGNLSFAGTASHPMTITRWDKSTNSPRADDGYGPPYIPDPRRTIALT